MGWFGGMGIVKVVALLAAKYLEQQSGEPKCYYRHILSTEFNNINHIVRHRKSVSILLVALQTISVFVRHNYRVCLSWNLLRSTFKCTLPAPCVRHIWRHYHNLIVYINRVQSHYSPGKKLISCSHIHTCTVAATS